MHRNDYVAKNTGFESKEHFWDSFHPYCHNLYKADFFAPESFDWDDGGKFGSMPYYVSHYLYEIEDWWIDNGDYYYQIFIDKHTCMELFPEEFPDEDE